MLIPKNLGTFLARNHDLEIPIGIEVGSDNVESDTCSLGRDILTEILELFIPSVVHDDRDIVGTRVPAVVPVNTLTGYQFVSTVAVQVRKMKSVGLTERIIDFDFIIKEVAVIIEALAKPCKDAVIMPIAPKQIALAIAIDIPNQYRARQALDPTWVKLPWTGIGIALGSFVPPRTDDDVTSPVVI